MFLLVVSSSLFSFWFFAILFYLLDHFVLGKRRRLRSVTESQKIEMYAELEKSFFDRFISPIIKNSSAFFGRLVPQKDSVNAAKANRVELLRKQLRFAGLTISVEEYNTIKIIFRVIATVVTISAILLAKFLGVTSFLVLFLLGLMGAITSLIGPVFFLKSRTKTRSALINRQLPEVMDLLSVSIEAGLGFDGALIKISETISGPLVDELMVLNRDIGMGCPRRLALRNFGECCDVKELKVFASSLAQAEQLGIPIKNVLNTQSAQIRTTRRQKAQEKGMKAPVKIMLPMVIFIFPVIFIILLGPTVMNLIKQFT